ncbi:MAG: histidinol-phosphate transaminase [Peptoniphilus sp.]|nr:histidinol-phosphate transaminase [Peptoniphilus sp.]MDD7363715.1 histidinol-phosphate transaminase [Bacillota bacterium]MDY6044100.1 histidinol-phosphate transaminase [Peptoniphilus sp.]
MEHGGDLETYRGAYSAPLIDFSSNINPLGIDPRVMERMVSALAGAERYPDISYRKLRRSLSEFLGADAEEIVVGNGAMEIIATCISLFSDVYIAEPCFNEYARIARGAGVAIHRFQTEPPFRLDVDAFIDSMPEGTLAILTNPNNPTGYLLSWEELDRIYGAVEARNGYLLLDETFIDFVDTVAMDRHWGIGRPRVIKVQAATKSAALAGIRLGYGILPASLRDAYAERTLPWTVNVVAAEAGCVLNRLEDYFDATRRYVRGERERLARAIDASTIGSAYESTANFLLIRLDRLDADRCFQFLLKRGILIRTYGDPPLRDRFIRIAVRTKEENDRLIAAWSELERSV